jgi:hypothetical protein
MSWSVDGLGTTTGLASVISGITGPAADASQISYLKTFLLTEVAGICSTLYNGGRLIASGSAADSARTIRISLTPMDIELS